MATLAIAKSSKKKMKDQQADSRARAGGFPKLSAVYIDCRRSQVGDSLEGIFIDGRLKSCSLEAQKMLVGMKTGFLKQEKILKLLTNRKVTRVIDGGLDKEGYYSP